MASCELCLTRLGDWLRITIMLPLCHSLVRLVRYSATGFSFIIRLQIEKEQVGNCKTEKLFRYGKRKTAKHTCKRIAYLQKVTFCFVCFCLVQQRRDKCITRKNFTKFFAENAIC